MDQLLEGTLNFVWKGSPPSEEEARIAKLDSKAVRYPGWQAKEYKRRQAEQGQVPLQAPGTAQEGNRQSAKPSPDSEKRYCYLLGREASPEEIAQAYEIAEAFGF
jgi:hypothetical protein